MFSLIFIFKLTFKNTHTYTSMYVENHIKIMAEFSINNTCYQAWMYIIIKMKITDATYTGIEKHVRWIVHLCYKKLIVTYCYLLFASYENES